MAFCQVRNLRDLKEPVPPDLLKTCSSAALKKIDRYRQSFGRNSQLAHDARQLASEVIGREDGSFRMGDVVRLHNHLRTLFVLFSCDALHDRWYELFRSDDVPADWAVQPLELDAKQRPVVCLYYTPPPQGRGAGHIDFICDPYGLATMLGLHGQTLCSICLKTYSSLAQHDCIRCPDCDHLACDAQAVSVSWSSREFKCGDCHMRFRTSSCFHNHKRAFPAGRGVPQAQSISEARESKYSKMYVVSRDSRPRPTKAKSQCQRWIYCASPQCRGLFPRHHISKGAVHDHQCGFELCKHCGAYAAKSHECMVQPAKEIDPSTDYVFFDSECHCVGKHEAYLIRIHDGLQNFGDDEHGDALGGYDRKSAWVGEKVGEYNRRGERVKWFFEGETCVDDFITWMVRKRQRLERGFTVIAHNGSGYDWVLIYRRLVLYDNGSLKVQPIYRSTALITVTLGYGKQRIRLIDSMLFAPGKLADYATTFDVEPQMVAAGYSGKKDFFPHWLGEHADGDVTQYSGDMPPREAYRPHHMIDKTRRELFEAWFVAESAKFRPATATPWEFMPQAKEYCEVDVQLLRCAMVVFRNSFLEMTLHEVEKEAGCVQQGVDPLQYVTLPSACFATWRSVFMPRDSVANLPLGVDAFVRAAYTGGRTEAFRFYWKSEGDEFAYYYDVNSEYPTVMVAKPYPLGHPLYFGTFEHFPKDSVVLSGPAELEDLSKYLSEGSMAILLVDLVCPDDLLRPVIGVKEYRRCADGRDALKYIFSLDPKSKVHLCSPSLKKALSLGYKVTAVYAVMWWPPDRVAPAAVDEKGNFNARSIYGSYMKTILRMKDLNGGWPKGCETAAQKRAYCAEYKSWPLNMGNQLRIKEVKVTGGLTFAALSCICTYAMFSSNTER